MRNKQINTVSGWRGRTGESRCTSLCVRGSNIVWAAVWSLLACQLVAVSTPLQHSGLPTDCWCNQKISAWNKRVGGGSQVYLKGELLIEDRIQGLPVDLGLELLLLVRQQVDLYVRVRCATHVHGGQLCSLDDPHDELMEEDEKCQSRQRPDRETTSGSKISLPLISL